MSRVPVVDLAGSGAVGGLVALGALDQGLGLQVLRATFVSNVVSTTAVGAGGDTGALEGLLQGLRGIDQSGHRISRDQTSAGGGAGLESREGGALDLVESSLNTVELLEANIGLLGLCEVSLSLLDDASLLQSLVALLLGGVGGGGLKGQGGEGIVGVGKGTSVGVGGRDKGLEVVKSVLSVVGGVVNVSEGGVVLDVDRLAGQSLLQILVAKLWGIDKEKAKVSE